MKIEIELDELTIAKSRLLAVGGRKICGLVFEKNNELAILDGSCVTWFTRDQWKELTQEQAQTE
jgi:hypothetical protein